MTDSAVCGVHPTAGTGNGESFKTYCPYYHGNSETSALTAWAGLGWSLSKT